MSVARELASLVSASPVTSGANLEKRGPAGTGAASAGVLLLSTAELTVVDSDQLGRIDFQAPLETGTDAIVVAASIYAEADDTFAADNNSTELVFATGASEAAAEKVRITSDGRVGIGTAAPTGKFQVEGDQNYLLYVKQSSTNVNLAAFRAASSTGLDLQLDGTNNVVRFNSTGTGDAIRFDTNDGTGRMRINSDGEVGISPSDADPTSTLQVSYVAGTVALAAYRNGGTIGQFQAQDTSGTREMIKFVDGAGTTCGSIDINAGTNTTAFSTSSDYRLKQNIKSLTSGLEKIKKLKPIQFNWKKIAGRDDTITNTGFIDHEVQEIIPESAIGEKDAVKTVKNAVWNKNGNLVEEDITKEKFEQKMAKGDYDQYEGQEFEWKASKETMEIQKVSKEPMIPFIVGALQELSDKIDSLEKKIGS